MTTIKEALDGAAKRGLIAEMQVAGLANWLVDCGFTVAPVSATGASKAGVAGLVGELSLPREGEPLQSVEESEAPRFVRGFHDILITIGIIVALLGISGLATVFALFPAIIVLSEILVKRQRLALPAVVLTIALALATAVCFWTVVENVESGETGRLLQLLELLGALTVCLLAYYARYRVPLSLAATIYFAVAALGALVFNGFTALSGSSDPLSDYRLLCLSVFLAFALGVFALAMWFDMRDPARRTRFSDVAFWLHLAAAPALLYAVLAMIFLRDANGVWYSESRDLSDAAIVVGVVAIFMLAGLVIDRRAFVTSGLLSLGGALWTFMRETHMSFGDNVFLPLLLVGVTVLVVGIGWQPLRRGILALLPPALRDHLPPAA